MKTSSEATYKMVYDGGEDPTLKTFSTNLDHNNNPIAPNTYYFAVSARNWIGEGQKSQPLSVVVTYRTSASVS